jgi:hypothetical protein
MIAIALLLVRMLCDLFKPRPRLEAEILILRHQLNILQQRTPRRRLHLRWIDRALFIWLYRPEHRQARDCRALASQGFYRLLAMEIPLAWWPTADRPRGARPDPKNEF